MTYHWVRNKRSTTDATSGTVAYPSGAHEFTSGF